MAAEPSVTNPYPGPRPFVAGENLYGRDREVTKLFYLLSAERIVVLHSPSGAGKSSLLNAGLVPRLRGERFDVWPTIRLSQPAANGGNRFVTSAVSSLEEGLPERRRRPARGARGLTLAEYVAGRPRRPGAPASVVLVFDQFEEVLTLDPLDRRGAARVLPAARGSAGEPRGLGAVRAARGLPGGARPVPRRRADPAEQRVPRRSAHGRRRPRCDRRGRHTTPAASSHPTPPTSSRTIWRRSRSSSPTAASSSETGLYVEPLQLQVVCRRLWDELPPDARTIGVENLLASGDVDAALGRVLRRQRRRARRRRRPGRARAP